MSVTVDASFISRGLIRSQVLASANEELEALAIGGEELVAPIYMKVEIASTLRRLESRQRLAPHELSDAQRTVDRLRLDLRWDDRWIDRALEIARACGLATVYDSVYLACAESYDLELYTCDARFARALTGGLRDRVRLFSL